MDVDPPLGLVEPQNEANNIKNPAETTTNSTVTENTGNDTRIFEINDLTDFNVPLNTSERIPLSLAKDAIITETAYSVKIGPTVSTLEPAAQSNEDAQSSVTEIIIEINDPFKIPSIPRVKKRPAQPSSDDNSLDRMSAGHKTVRAITDTEMLESELHKHKKVNIYTNDEGPKWYDTNENILNISKTIVPTRLLEAFKFLPIYGQPKSKSDLEEFYTNKAKDYFECGASEHEYAQVKRRVSTCLNKISRKCIKLQSSIPGAGILNDMMIYRPEEQDSGNKELHVLKRFRMRRDQDVNNIFTKKLKYRGIRLMPLQEYEMTPEEAPDLQPGKDLMFHVRIYRPFPYNKLKAYRGRHSVFSRDLIMIGSQRLNELRDSFVCANDVDMRVDMSECISDQQVTTAKELFPSGFLFINNVFYVDSRPGCTDSSARIRDWALTKRGLGRFPVKDMSTVRLDELKLKLGHPEVYVHQGNCEHLFTFSEIRLVGPTDPLHLSHYPCHTAISQNQTVYCTTCAEFGAKFIVTGCERTPFDPAFFCDTCLRLYLYKNGRKICDFKAYSYRGNEMHSKTQG